MSLSGGLLYVLQLTAILVLTRNTVCLARPSPPSLFAAPSILSPNASSVWTAGSVQPVRWRWDYGGLDVPANKHGQVVLGYYNPSGDSHARYEYHDQPLANGFLLSHEVVNIVVPDALPGGHHYYVLLLGDAPARSHSALFSIDNPTSTTPSTQTPSSTEFPEAFPPSLRVLVLPPRHTSTPGSAPPPVLGVAHKHGLAPSTVTARATESKSFIRMPSVAFLQFLAGLLLGALLFRPVVRLTRDMLLAIAARRNAPRSESVLLPASGDSDSDVHPEAITYAHARPIHPYTSVVSPCLLHHLQQLCTRTITLRAELQEVLEVLDLETLAVITTAGSSLTLAISTHYRHQCCMLDPYDFQLDVSVLCRRSHEEIHVHEDELR
ncbi:hypothetical protein C8Q73DRAFT_668141 [Cubamyces lactineus]|nr:hypothetical protein C8Q73DRAFT_668141 [Cubamyces lactineus]